MISGAHVIIYSKDRPCLKQQETFINFTIAPDGHLLAMRLENSTPGTALDKAAGTQQRERPICHCRQE